MCIHELNDNVKLCYDFSGMLGELHSAVDAPCYMCGASSNGCMKD